MNLTPDFYVLLALLAAVAIFAVVLLQRMDALTRQLQESAKRQDEAETALRERVKASEGNLDQRLARAMEADAKAQTQLDALIRAQHAAIEANSRATDQLAGAVADLKSALIESTKL
jgi:type II secretory pathway component PulJ